MMLNDVSCLFDHSSAPAVSHPLENKNAFSASCIVGIIHSFSYLVFLWIFISLLYFVVLECGKNIDSGLPLWKHCSSPHCSRIALIIDNKTFHRTGKISLNFLEIDRWYNIMLKLKFLLKQDHFFYLWSFL